ncbi:MAG TPA: hypothetical protein VE093_37775 [Polyangiaceae bacterium]|jgi:hypothetical protein|nr:hypothetical protein [Polyangiaceae bacterium]
MSVFLITYDKSAGDNYQPLYDAIHKLANGYWHDLDSTWLIVSNQSALAIANALYPHIDANDKLLVVEITRQAAWAGKFNPSAKAWLNNHLPAYAAAPKAA